MNTFIDWCNYKKLTINIKKTKVMLFGTRYKINRNNNLKIRVNNEYIQTVPTYKYLGIHYDQTLCFNYHLKHNIYQIKAEYLSYSMLHIASLFIAN